MPTSPLWTQQLMTSDHDRRSCRGSRRASTAAVVRFAASASYAVGLQPSEPGWLDMSTCGLLIDRRRVPEKTGWGLTR